MAPGGALPAAKSAAAVASAVPRSRLVGRKRSRQQQPSQQPVCAVARPSVGHNPPVPSVLSGVGSARDVSARAQGRGDEGAWGGA
eukprot:scaffold119606_cov32-Prasinocladus_malaysianus.AAC.1